MTGAVASRLTLVIAGDDPANARDLLPTDVAVHTLHLTPAPVLVGVG